MAGLKEKAAWPLFSFNPALNAAPFPPTVCPAGLFYPHLRFSPPPRLTFGYFPILPSCPASGLERGVLARGVSVARRLASPLALFAWGARRANNWPRRRAMGEDSVMRDAAEKSQAASQAARRFRRWLGPACCRPKANRSRQPARRGLLRAEAKWNRFFWGARLSFLPGPGLLLGQKSPQAMP